MAGRNEGVESLASVDATESRGLEPLECQVFQDGREVKDCR